MRGRAHGGKYAHVGGICSRGDGRLGRPAERSEAPALPAHYQIENVPEASLTEAQARYFAPYDEKLAAMNYRPVCTYLISNFGKILTRQYVNPAESARCEVAIQELVQTVDGKQAFTS